MKNNISVCIGALFSIYFNENILVDRYSYVLAICTYFLSLSFFISCDLIKELKLWKKENFLRYFYISIKPAKDCLFSRRNGYEGIIICKYSVYLRLFGKEIL